MELMKRCDEGHKPIWYYLENKNMNTPCPYCIQMEVIEGLNALIDQRGANKVKEILKNIEIRHFLFYEPQKGEEEKKKVVSDEEPMQWHCSRLEGKVLSQDLQVKECEKKIRGWEISYNQVKGKMEHFRTQTISLQRKIKDQAKRIKTLENFRNNDALIWKRLYYRVLEKLKHLGNELEELK